MDIGNVFDEMSGEYTDIMDSMVPHYRKLLTSLVEYLPQDFAPRSILELGCGNGNATHLISSRFPGVPLHLVDASEEMLAQCAERHRHLAFLTFEQSFFQELILNPETYDLVVAGVSLHHLDHNEKKDFFPAVYSCLKPGGYFTCCDLFINKEDPEHASFLEEWKIFIENNGAPKNWDWLMDHYGKYDKPTAYSDQERWLLEAGFSSAIQCWNFDYWGCFQAKK
jgi:tRNA (cmo5U34)-methyltransferase